jgi:hypothetical protein
MAMALASGEKNDRIVTMGISHFKSTIKSTLAQEVKIFPAYDAPLRIAVWCELAGFALSTLVLDLGEFRHEYLWISLAFWIVAGVLSITRPNPTQFERKFIAWGPLLIFAAMFFVPWILVVFN